MSDVLGFIFLGTDGYSEHVFVEWVPNNSRDHLRGFGVLGICAFVAVSQQRQVSVLSVVRVVNEELLQVSLL